MTTGWPGGAAQTPSADNVVKKGHAHRIGAYLNGEVVFGNQAGVEGYYHGFFPGACHLPCSRGGIGENWKEFIMIDTPIGQWTTIPGEKEAMDVIRKEERKASPDRSFSGT